MELSSELIPNLEKELTHSLEKEITIKKWSSEKGGDTSSSFKIDTNEGPFFLKIIGKEFSHFFEKEYNGLQLLKEQHAIAISSPLCYGETDQLQFLLQEYIVKSHAQFDFWDSFAKGLAQLHKKSSDQFGLKEDNYIGRLPQSNESHDTWSKFYVSQRLHPLIKQCYEDKLLEDSYIKAEDILYQFVERSFPDDPPALLHGDLWGGNYLIGQKGIPVLFDPAVYYGNREMDLAMARLFGGFDRSFFWHYEEYYPLSEGWEKRIALCQLYPLLVHSLLFGGGYIHRVKRIIDDYVGR